MNKLYISKIGCLLEFEDDKIIFGKTDSEKDFINKIKDLTGEEIEYQKRDVKHYSQYSSSNLIAKLSEEKEFNPIELAVMEETLMKRGFISGYSEKTSTEGLEDIMILEIETPKIKEQKVVEVKKVPKVFIKEQKKILKKTLSVEEIETLKIDAKKNIGKNIEFITFLSKIPSRGIIIGVRFDKRNNFLSYRIRLENSKHVIGKEINSKNLTIM